MLQSPTGTTIAAMMQATGWQAAFGSGFLAGVVRKKLKLKLDSIKWMAIVSTASKGMHRPGERTAIQAPRGLKLMPRVKFGPAPRPKTLDVELARLRDLDAGALRAGWQNVFGKQPSPHLPRHLLFRVLAYRLQADQLGDLDSESQRLLDNAASPEAAGKRPWMTAG